jgi:N-methylhydantoinase B
VGVHSARTSTPALGLAGGGPGATGKITLNGIKADIRHQFTMVPGDLLVLETPGGGGWGDPAIATDR